MLPSVLITVLLLLVIGAALALQAKSELKASRLERDIVQVQTIISSAMDEASHRARSDPAFAIDFPDPSSAMPGSWQSCTPEPVDATNPTGAQYCIDYLRRNDSATVAFGSNTQWNCATLQRCGLIPVRIRYRLSSADAVTSQTFGWLLVQFTNTNKTNVQSVRTFTDHQWCRDGLDSGSNACG